MFDIKTANDNTRNYSKSFKRYLKTRSTRDLTAIFRTKRLDAGFFWLEFFPLVRDIFLTRHRQLTEKDFEVMLQLHANQPFTVDDVYDSTVKGKGWGEDWSKKTSYGIRATKGFLAKMENFGYVRVFKMNGRYNKKMYEFTPKTNTEFRRFYEHILCISKIRFNEKEHVPPEMKKSRAHYKKMIKQNFYRDCFSKELKRDIKTTNREITLKLKNARINLEKS